MGWGHRNGWVRLGWVRLASRVPAEYEYALYVISWFRERNRPVRSFVLVYITCIYHVCMYACMQGGVNSFPSWWQAHVVKIRVID